MVLKGPFADEESATATVNGQPVGLIKATESKYVKVDSGNHVVKVTTNKIPTTFTKTVLVGKNTNFTFEVPCEAGKLSIKADGLYALENTKLTVYIDGNIQGVILPGEFLHLANVAPKLTGHSASLMTLKNYDIAKS